MAKVITADMVENLNETLKELGCCFKYVLHEDDHIPTMEVKLNDNSGFVDCFNISVNFTETYYTWLNTFFATKYGIKLVYNNTGSIIWSNESIV